MCKMWCFQSVGLLRKQKRSETTKKSNEQGTGLSIRRKYKLMESKDRDEDEGNPED